MSKMLLLSCCTPCSCAVIKDLAELGRDFSVLFYNPNISPQEEYEKRKEANKKYCFELGVEFIDLDYDNALWTKEIAGLESEPERGERCKKCFLLRLRRAAQYAKDNGFDSFSSVLSLSRYKNLTDVNAMAALAEGEFGVPYESTDWRKNNTEARSHQIIKEKNIYTQNYCGCQFSKRHI